MILGRYVLHGEIASGGMATVCLGRALGAAGFSRPVAIKRLHPHLVKDPDFSVMFLDEARLAARVRHPNVVATLDVVATEGELLLVMEYVPGESLASVAKSLGTREPPSARAVPPAIAVSIVSAALHGLHAAHEARGEDGRPLEIVHRDVSPHNILVGEDGVARLLDFGIARAAVRSQSTRTGQLKGKLRYMAPEQLHGAPATRRVDLYATAVVLWEALTGDRLFDGETDAAIYGRILEGVVRPPSAIAGSPPALDAVVLRGLARDPATRFATALDMAVALETALPPAPAREVAAWLQRISGPVLAMRAQRVRDIEGGADGSAPSDSARAPAPGAPSSVHDGAVSARFDPAEGTMTATRSAHATLAVPAGADVPATAAPMVSGSGAASAGASRFDRRSVVAAGAALSMALAIAAVARATSAAAPAVPPARRGIAAAALLASLRASTAFALPAASASAMPSEPSTDPALPPAPKPRAHLGGPGRTRSACDPPYVVDATGIRRVKRECL